MESVPRMRRGRARPGASKLGKASAAFAALALVATALSVAAAPMSASAVETKGSYKGSGGAMRVTTATKQAMQVECFSKIATAIKYLEPNVTRPVWAPKNITSTPEAFTPPTSDTDPFMQVLGTNKTGSTGTVPATMINTGKPVSLYKFVLYFKTPVANPRLNLAGTEMTQIAGGVPSTSSGLNIAFSNAYAYTGKSTPIASVGRVSGIDQAPNSAYRISGNAIVTDTVACDGNSGGCGDNYAQRLAAVKAKIPSVNQLTTPLRGTVELNTNGVPVSKITVTVGATFFSAKDGAQTIPVPGFAIAPQFRSEVSAFQRTLGKYGHAMHAMPFVGNDNLRFGATIQEGNRDRYTAELNSGTATDNSDAGYDGMGTFYFEGDKKKTPVTSVTSKDKGKWLMLDLTVASKRTDKTAYVYGFIDWTGKGDFAKVDKGKSTLGCVSKGNGKVTIKWKVPSTVTSDPINVRLRTSYDCCEIDKPTGSALSGEVEDWPGALNGQKNNLKVAKQVVSGSVARSGDKVVYEVAVNNLDGKATTKAVTVSDTLPAELTGLAISTPASFGTASLAGSTLTWTLPAGMSAPATIRVSGTLADGVASKDVVNTARLSGLCDPGNCEASATFKANPALNADLTLTKEIESMTQDPARAGTTIRYVVTIGYTGDASLTNVTFVDSLIPNLTDWTCSAPLTTTIDPGFTSTCRASYTVRDEDMVRYWDDGELPNTATVKGNLSVYPGTELSREATVKAPLDTATARLDITGSVESDIATAVPGQMITFAITATNEGQSTASNVQLNYVLKGAAPALVDPASCTWSGLPSQLASGDTVTCRVPYRAQVSDLGTEIVLSATANAMDGSTPYGPVDLGSAAVPVEDSDLVISKTNLLPGSRPMVDVGDTFTYAISVTNRGNAPATNVRVVDSLPFGLVFDPADQDGWTFSGQQATSDPFSVDVNETVTLELGVRVTEDSDGTLLNVASIQGMSTSVECRADKKAVGCAQDDHPPFSVNSRVTAIKESSVPEDESVEIGHRVSYTITVTNASSLPATNVRLEDVLPAGLKFDPAEQDGWTISPTLITAVHDPFDLDAGGSSTFELEAVAVERVDGSVRNTVVVTNYDMVLPADGSGFAKAAPAGSADNSMPAEYCEQYPSIERCAFAQFAGITARTSVQTQVVNLAPSQVAPGDAYSYLVTAINYGSAPSPAYSMVASLPSGLMFDGAQDPVWRIEGNTATLTATDIPARSALSFRLRVKVAAGAQGMVQLFTTADGTPLSTCQADWSQAGCGADRDAPVVK